MNYPTLAGEQYRTAVIGACARRLLGLCFDAHAAADDGSAATKEES